ncbi:MAG: HlyD family efflux transporter periplasmic adaptor subunit [Opitutaceae bacterium]|nr:HlyD family efflux transporter periplasmic adaptor subunit [Opitutaceae bacterium]
MNPNHQKSPGAKPARAARRWTRFVPWIAGGIVVALIVTGLWPKPLPAELATVARGPLQLTVNEEGMTRLKFRYSVSSPVAGLLRRIDLKPGTAVEAGKTVLATLETRDSDFLDARTRAQAEAAVKAATAMLAEVSARRESAAAAAVLARTEFERIQMLYTSGSASRQEFDAAELRHTVAEQNSRAAGFALQVAEHELQQARAMLARGTGTNDATSEPLVITSPITGRILKVFQESERVVPAGFPLLEVGDPTDIEARIEVLSRDAVAIKPGATALLHKWGGVEPLRARVRVVEPAAFTKISALGVEEQRVYVVADLLNPPDERPSLGDSYRVEGSIVVWSSDDALKAPSGAFFQRGSQWMTYRVDGSRARLCPVRIAHNNGIEAEVLEGLAAGDKVVVYPGDRLTDGSRIEAMTVTTH